MRYRIKNLLCLSVLALILSQYNASLALAQGVVTLAEDAEQNDPALNQDIPDELSLFDETHGLETIGLPSDNNAAPSQPTAKEENPLPLLEVPARNQAPAADPIPQPFQPANAQPMASLPAPSGGADNSLDNLLAQPGAGIGILGNNTSTPIDDAVFSKMSDLEKQTALLNLELRRERVKNEIEAIKNQRKQALEQEKEKEEAKQKAKVEWEKAQEQKVIAEQQKLRELDIQFEKVRQEKLLNAYKNQMLATNQNWIKNNADLYASIDKMKAEKQAVAEDAKNKLAQLKQSVASAVNVAIEGKASLQREIADLQTQISILKSRIEAQEKEMERQNPFAEEGENNEAISVAATTNSAVTDARLSDMYAVMEIRGQGGELIAKLINQDGTPFYVKKGTSLQSGHIIDEITSTYVRADKNGMKDYLYFAAGGILPLEPLKSEIGVNSGLNNAMQTMEEELPAREFISSDGVPGLGRDMMAR